MIKTKKQLILFNYLILDKNHDSDDSYDFKYFWFKEFLLSLYNKMNQMIKTESVDFKALVNKNTKISIEFQSKMVEKMKETFTSDEEQWYTANLFMYLNYHQTNDFPIDLGNVFSIMGFLHKKNAKRTLQTNFIENEDYKIHVLPDRLCILMFFFK